MKSTRSGILAGGNWIIDRIKIIDQYPHQDGLANILFESTNNGGSPYNLLKDLANLQVPFPLMGIGLVGDDENGRTILGDCFHHNIDSTGIRSGNGVATSYTDVMTVKSTGRRTFFHQRGANALLGKDDFNFTDQKAKIFHLGYLLLLDRLDRFEKGNRTGASLLLEEVQQWGFQTSVDVVSESSNRFQKIVPSALPFVNLLFINEYEAQQVTGIPISNGDAVDFLKAQEAAKALIRLGVNDWVFLHFNSGVVAVNNSGKIYFQSAVKLPPENMGGTAGAGDALAAGILLGIHENWSIQECLEMGVSTAATSLTDPSCSSGVLPHQETLKFARALGFQNK